MRLVGVVVADRREHRDLALAVQRRERRGRRVPAQPGVLGEREPRRCGQREVRAQLRSRAGRRPGRAPRARRSRRRGRPRRAPAAAAASAAPAIPSSRNARGEPRAAVDREREPGGPGDERRRVRPVPAGSGIPGSIAGSPRPASATARRRSSVRLQSSQAISRSGGRGRRRGAGAARSRRPAAPLERFAFAKSSSALLVSGVSVGLPRAPPARARRAAADRLEPSCGFRAAKASAAMNQRARKVAVSSQRVSSQPATFGG